MWHRIDLMQTLESALGGPLEGLIKKAKQLAAINVLFKTLLDPQLAAHCNVANLENHTLTILCDSAAFSTRIGFQKEQILQGLQVAFKEIRNIRCKVSPR